MLAKKNKLIFSDRTSNKNDIKLDPDSHLNDSCRRIYKDYS
jgi:hypothetical protein